MRPCFECYPPSAQVRAPTTGERAPEVWAAVKARSGGQCEVQSDGCWRWPIAPHHRLRQAQGGPDTPENIVAVCDWCHRLGPEAIHRLGGLAYEAGLLIRQADGPPTTPWSPTG